MAFVNERTEDGQWQTIDRERDVVLKYLGGGRPQEPMNFEIVIDGVPIKFQALQKTETLHDIKKMNVVWDVWRVFIPPTIETSKEQIFRTIEEALHGFGTSASTKNVASLNVNFLPDV